MDIILTIGAYLIGFILVVVSIPPIVKVARAKHLFDAFDDRKIHTTVVPPLGGVAIFIGTTLSSIIATDGISFDALKYIIASIILMFFIGLKDDLIGISVRKKLLIQIFAAVLLITMGNVRFTFLHGILGVGDIGYITSLLLSVFVFVVIINAFNLIDGIDGLASGLGILSATFFGVWFFIAGKIQFSILSFALVGSLSGFFIYNVFGNKNKLFMGDTGSLIIGLVISTLAIKFNEFNIDKSLTYSVISAPSVSFAFIIVPLIDTLRVMFIRISNRKSPFFADKNHIHHLLLNLVHGHLKVTLIIVSANAIVIAFALFLNNFYLNTNLQFLLVFLFGALISYIPVIILKLKNTRNGKIVKPISQIS